MGHSDRSSVVGVALLILGVCGASPSALADSQSGAVSVEKTTDVLSTTLGNMGQASPSHHPEPLEHLLSLQHGDGLTGISKAGGLRAGAMRQEGVTVGAQAGLRFRNQEIQKIIHHYGRHLSDVFNFLPLMIERVVTPPVVQRVTNSVRQYDNDTMRTVRVGYRLVHRARIVTQPPTWRSFLTRSYAKPEVPPDVLLPKNSGERQLWQSAVRQGWVKGVHEANDNFKIDLNLLTSTYLGMLQYKLLLSEHLVSKPNLATTGLRITSEGRRLNIGDEIYRLNRHSHFENPKNWQAVPTAAISSGHGQ
jgi:defect-in-organelle-trafficking protein DotC